MSVYTITLSPEEDAALRARAHQTGRPPEDLLGQAVRAQFLPPTPDALPSEVALLDEYHDLVDRDLAGTMTAAQAARLKAVEEALDDRDAHSPEARWMDARMAETTQALDQMLHAVHELAARRAAG